MERDHFPKELEPYPIKIFRKVLWSDIDSYQHVNNVQYIRYFEDVRAEFFYRIGLLETIEKEGVGMVVGTVAARYLSSMTFPDIAVLGVRVAKVEEKRLLLEYKILSEESGKVSVEGETICYAYDQKAGRSCSIPDLWKKNIRELHPELGV